MWSPPSLKYRQDYAVEQVLRQEGKKYEDEKRRRLS